MSKSRKSRSGTRCKQWKDTVMESRTQKRALARKKRKRARIDRAKGKAVQRKETT